METNLTNLMSQVSELEKEKNQLYYTILSQSSNEVIIELNGNRQTMKEFPDFQKNFERYELLTDEIAKFKGIIFKKNNEYKLSSGLTIQEALIYVRVKRAKLDLIDELVQRYPSKHRVVETNNSHFVSKELNYDRTKMEQMKNDLLIEIQNLEFEISKLNSITFTI